VVIAANALSIPASVGLLVKDGAPVGQSFPYVTKALVSGPLTLVEVRQRVAEEDFPYQQRRRQQQQQQQ